MNVYMYNQIWIDFIFVKFCHLRFFNRITDDHLKAHLLVPGAPPPDPKLYKSVKKQTVQRSLKREIADEMIAIAKEDAENRIARELAEQTSPVANRSIDANAEQKAIEEFLELENPLNVVLREHQRTRKSNPVTK